MATFPLRRVRASTRVTVPILRRSLLSWLSGKPHVRKLSFIFHVRKSQYASRPSKSQYPTRSTPTSSKTATRMRTRRSSKTALTSQPVSGPTMVPSQFFHSSAPQAPLKQADLQCRLRMLLQDQEQIAAGR